MKRYAVDLDATMAEYHEWEGICSIGRPLPPMVNRVKRWLADGHDVFVFTSRVLCEPPYENDDQAAGIAAVEAWCEQNLGRKLRVVPKSAFSHLYDDRAIQVMKNTGETLIEHLRRDIEFKRRLSMEDGETYCSSTLEDILENLLKLEAQ